MAGLEHALAEKQHAPVEHAGLAFLSRAQCAAMRRRLAFGEGPARRLERKVELADLEKMSGLAQRSSAPLATRTTEPPIVAEASAPASIVRPSAIRLGRPISKPCSMISMCSPSRGRSKVLHDAGEGGGRAAGRRVFATPQAPANMRA